MKVHRPRIFLTGLTLAALGGLWLAFRSPGARQTPIESVPSSGTENRFADQRPEVAHVSLDEDREMAVTTKSIELRDGFDESMINDFESPLYESSVIAGAVTREMYGIGYDERIAEIAHRQMFGRDDPTTHVPSFCGLEDLEAYDKLERDLTDSAPQLALELKQLFAESDRLANQLPDYMEAAWESGVAVQIKAAGTQDEVPVWWRKSQSASTERGLFRQYRSIQVGDRDFYFSFNSADFIDFEHQLKTLKRQRDDFWREVRKLQASGG